MDTFLPNSKKFAFLTLLTSLLFVTTMFGQITLIASSAPSSTPISISADQAQNATAGAFTPLGNIIVQERTNTNGISDFSTNFNQITLTAPAGWQFNATAGSVTATKTGADITSIG